MLPGLFSNVLPCALLPNRPFFQIRRLRLYLVLLNRLADGQTPFNWSGFYIGGNLGSDWLHYHAGNSGDTVTTIVDMNPPATGFISVSGFDRYDTTLIGGGQLGYNFQFGILVLGLEGDFDGISSGGVGKLFTPSPFGPTFNSERTFDRSWSASGRLRAGVAWKHFLFYGTGGGALTDVRMHVVDGIGGPAPGALPVSSGSDKAATGWVAGVGAEYALTKAISLGLEYRHAGFNTEITPPAGTAAILGSVGPGSNHFVFHGTSVSPSDDQVTVRINFLFNGLLGH